MSIFTANRVEISIQCEPNEINSAVQSTAEDYNHLPYLKIY